MKPLSDYYKQYTNSFYYPVPFQYDRLKDGIQCESFITETLQYAEKNQIHISKLYPTISGLRKKHIISCCILGTIIYFENEIIKNAILVV